MAIAFARVSIHSRSHGHSAVAASSYRAGVKLIDERTGIIHDYSKRHGVVFSEMLLPDGAHKSYLEREFFWNKLESCETRRNSQLCKDIVLALPKELDRDLQVELTKLFVQSNFLANGMPADVAIHDHGDGNPHAHILIPTRRLGHDGFAKHKARDLNPTFAKGFIVEKDFWGERWRDFQNKFFLEKNIALTVDLNHFIAERHCSRKINGNNNYLAEENQLIKDARLDIATANIDNLVTHLYQQCSVFTRKDVEKLLFKTFNGTQNPVEYLAVVEKLLAHKHVIKLGKNNLDHDAYTTRWQYLQEVELSNNLQALMKRNNHNFNDYVCHFAQKYSLSEEQLVAFDYIKNSPDISVVVGRPGTGKSYLLKPVKEYFEQHQCQVIGAALSGKVAKALQTDTGIASSTIASMVYRISNNHLQLSNKHILVIDEAGMVDFANMALLIKKARKAGSKIILIGDPDQLKPIHKGEIFKGIANHTGYIELENIKRQNNLGDRKASLNLAKGNIDAALAHYHSKGGVIFSNSREQSIQKLVDDWQQNLSPHNLSDSIMLAFSRAAVFELNISARAALKTKNIIASAEIIYQSHDKKLNIATGERLLFRQNNKDIGVRNGDLGTLIKVQHNQLQVKLDSGEKIIIPNSYKAIDYGYALTVHKSQGMTSQNTFALIDSKYWDRHLSFVAMTRHQEKLKIYADTTNHKNIASLQQTLAQSITKDNVIDWPINYAIRYSFDPDNVIGRIINKCTGAQSKDNVKPKSPLINELESLLTKRAEQSGYFAERTDKEISKLWQKIALDKNLAIEIKKNQPKLYSRLQNCQHCELVRE